MSASSEPAPRGNRALFTWVHLADIHRGEDANRGRDLFLDQLRDDIVRMAHKEDVPRPEAILVAGNCATADHSGEHEATLAWLRELSTALKIDRDRVFVVPGRLDTAQDMSSLGPATWRLLRDLRDPRDPKDRRDDIDHALNDAHERKLLMRRFTRYQDFARSLMPTCSAPPNHLLFWNHRFRTSDGLGIRLIGLNTALLWADKMSGKGHIGNEQLAFSLRPPPKNFGELAIVLSHHPLEGADFTDMSTVSGWIHQLTHVQLSGYPDRIEQPQAETGAGARSLHFGAGLCGTSGEDFVYRLASVVLQDDQEEPRLLLRTWSRKWSHHRKHFRQDEVQEGVTDEQEIRGSWSHSATVVFHRRAKSANVVFRAVKTPLAHTGDSGSDAYLLTFEKDGRWLGEEQWSDRKLVGEDWAEDNTTTIPDGIRKKLVRLLESKERQEAEYKDRQQIKPAVDRRFEVSLNCGRVAIRENNEEIASGRWREGRIDGPSEQLGDEETSEKIYRAIEMKLREMCRNR